MQSPVWLTESVHGELAPIVWGFHVAVPDNGHSSAFVSCFYVGTEDLLFGVSLTQSKLSLKTNKDFIGPTWAQCQEPSPGWGVVLSQPLVTDVWQVLRMNFLDPRDVRSPGLQPPSEPHSFLLSIFTMICGCWPS